ncbi:MAG: isocitrate/isopropylmalate family dehydrogenase, partial [Nodosilinea sp.]
MILNGLLPLYPLASGRCSPPSNPYPSTAMTSSYRITLLPGDGIGPEIMAVAVDVLKTVGGQMNLAFEFEEALIGGAAIDET